MRTPVRSDREDRLRWPVGEATEDDLTGLRAAGVSLVAFRRIGPHFAVEAKTNPKKGG